MSHPDQPTSAGAARRRDRGLRRVGSTTRWVAAAAAVGSVALATGYAHALPGKSSPAPGNTWQPSTPAPAATSSTPAVPRTASHSVAPSRTAAPSSRTATHTTVAKHRTTPATHPAAPAPTATKPATPTPQPSHTTSGAS
ncbi:hypothetical protein HEP84_40610 [Streptomyces sp. RLB1-33]|uniref:hypothetical protein n=1 Tax=Streptomyces mirabilis TaxID=68239 RepID=UPI00143EF043|nr:MULTISPECIES: hypothetical protein [Streptomyces]QIY74478.1 hypothetical protein HEP84_40610 [Streptomyces sp. RLB1-33]QUW78384.1 hypothetical protein SMIR_03885 [Streptomyces mirabilis]